MFHRRKTIPPDNTASGVEQVTPPQSIEERPTPVWVRNPFIRKLVGYEDKPQPFWYRNPVIRAVLAAVLLSSLVFLNHFFAVADPTAAVSVVTYKNNSARTGFNDKEQQLTTANVNPKSFGKKIAFPVDGRIYAQPLFVPGVIIKGVAHNVVFVATEHDSIYAFDADETQDTAPLWHRSFVDGKDIIPKSNDDAYCDDIGDKDAGLTGTPVIDLKAKTLYVVASTKEHNKLYQKLHALDISTGKDRTGSPATITATVSGAHGKVNFDPKRENQRTGLLLSNGVVYISWGSHCDNAPYYGWVMGYNARTMKQVSVWNSDADNGGGGIWMSGAAPSADTDGNIYLETGEGDATLPKHGTGAGDTLVKLHPKNGLQVVDYFTPFNQECMQWHNEDFGSAGVLLIPGTNEMIAAGKEGRLYIIDRTKLGGFQSTTNACDKLAHTDIDKVVQELPAGTVKGGVWGIPTYWDGPDGQYIFVSGRGDTLKAFKLVKGKLSAKPVSQAANETDEKGKRIQAEGNPVVSCNGKKPGTAIVWLIDEHGYLRAYDATSLSHELYWSGAMPERDHVGDVIKFSVPTVANGEVFVGTTNSLVVYGLFK